MSPLIRKIQIALIAVAAAAIGVGVAQAETLRLLTWSNYAPENVVEMFTKETGIEVQVTLSNNEEMVAKLRATDGGGCCPAAWAAGCC